MRKRFEEEKQRAEAYRIALEASVNKPSKHQTIMAQILLKR